MENNIPVSYCDAYSGGENGETQPIHTVLTFRAYLRTSCHAVGDRFRRASIGLDDPR
jgi:hypothetical protein